MHGDFGEDPCRSLPTVVPWSMGYTSTRGLLQRCASIGGILALTSTGLYAAIPLPNAFAFSLTECYWSKGVGTPVYWLKPARDAGNAVTAANSWNRAASGKHPSFYATTSTPSYGFTVQVANFGSWNGTDGLWTPPSSCIHTGINSGKVQINSYYLDQKSYTQTVDIGVITHEMGHAEGLGHQDSTNCSYPAIMHPYTDIRTIKCGWSTPQKDDISGLSTVYS